MKNLICVLLIFSFSTSAFGDCDWSTIKSLPNGNWEYSKELNICVGNLVQDAKVKDKQILDLNQAVQIKDLQISDYTKAIQLKDLAIQTSDSRVVLWQKSAEDEQDRMNKLQAEQKHTDFLYFGLGVLSAIGMGFATAKLIGH